MSTENLESQADPGWAVDENGQLKDASEMGPWPNSPSEETTDIPPPSPSSDGIHLAATTTDPESEEEAPRTRSGAKRLAPIFTEGKAGETRAAPKSSGGRVLSQHSKPCHVSARSKAKVSATKEPPRKARKTRQEQDALADSQSSDEEEEEGDGKSDSEDEHRRKKRERPIRSHRGEDERTQDIRLMYEAAQMEVSGKQKNGHICQVCLRELGLSKGKSFMTGSGTSLRKHIARHFKTHGSHYLRRCKEANIEPHPTALPDDYENSSGDPKAGESSQTTLDGHVVVKHTWTPLGMLEHLTPFIVTNDLALSIIEDRFLRGFILYNHPQTREADIPHRTMFSDFVLEKHQ
ncbi:hypothetical protein EV121DRAFT_298121 [Schizophyllum commune]